LGQFQTKLQHYIKKLSNNRTNFFSKDLFIVDKRTHKKFLFCQFIATGLNQARLISPPHKKMGKKFLGGGKFKA